MSGTSRWPPEVLDAITAQSYAAGAFADAVIAGAPRRSVDRQRGRLEAATERVVWACYAARKRASSAPVGPDAKTTGGEKKLL